MQWLRLGLFQSIRPTIKYQHWKVDVVADNLSRNQRKLEEGSMDDSAIVVAMIKAQISTLSVVSMELIAKDLQRWATTYKEDKDHVAACISYARDTNMKTFIWFNQVWWQEWWGGRQKIIIPKSLWQTNIKGMPRCAFHRPCGHVQDSRTCGPAIPLVRTRRWHNPVCEDVPYVLNDEIRQQGKGWVTIAFGNSLKETGACNHGPRYWLTWVERVHGHCGLCRQIDKNGAPRRM